MSERRLTVPDFWAHIAGVVGLIVLIVAFLTGRPLWLMVVATLILLPSVVVMWKEKPKRRP
ncbi:hypothetical protein [Streptomyces sp. NBC_00620]|uniref:hypothetical protein n=1 Tax=Streptomyces sp. NBC_00620 TaxID=2903666 RepID=UPI00225338B5|nr:hypothetical protein [Streptomyces sp. NBC_00620]MCX4973700.1 hypothetical protein [Streptomyces sp. NBC_00620]